MKGVTAFGIFDMVLLQTEEVINHAIIDTVKIIVNLENFLTIIFTIFIDF